MTTVYCDRTFSASHRLPDYDGPCADLHGHNWRVEVWITGNVNAVTGMLIDFREIKEVIDSYDHTHLNDMIPNPTAEYLAYEIWKRLFQDHTDLSHCTVRVWESDHAYAEYG